MPTHRKTFRALSGAFLISKEKLSTPAIEAIIDTTISNGATDQAVSVFVEATGLKSFHLWSDKVVTVKTNSSSSPQETFSLNGIDPVSWIEGETGTIIAGDVTQLFITNASGSTAVLKMLAGWG